MEELLSSTMSLISDRKGKQNFGLYLKSPYLVKDGELYESLFSYLYPKVAGSKPSAVKVVSVLKEVYGDSSYDKHSRALRRDIRLLCDEIIRFNSLERFKSEPVEQARLSTRALGHQGVPVLYRREQKKWEDAATDLPAGTHGAFHRWASAHAGYFSLEVTKTKFEEDEFDRAMRSFEELYQLHRSLYKYESLRDDRIEGDSGWIAIEEEINAPSRTIIQLYRELFSLFKKSESDWEAYRAIKKKVLNGMTDFEADHAIAIILGLQNYVQRQKLNGPDIKESELYFWPHFLLRSRHVTYFFAIPRVNFDNQVHRFLICGQLKLAERFFDRFISFVPANERERASISNKIAFAFFRSDYQRAVELIEAFRKQYDTRKVNESVHNQLRMHSYYIRSLFCIYIDAEQDEVGENLERALANLKRFINRNSEYLGRNNHLERIKNFRTVCHMTLTFIRDSTFEKSTVSIIRFIENCGAIHAKQWWLDFLNKL